MEGIAHQHSASMAAADHLSHDGFQSRFRMTGLGLCVENLASGGNQPAIVISAWRRSPSHHAALLEPEVSLVGVAVVGRYTTLLACSSSDQPRYAVPR